VSKIKAAVLWYLSQRKGFSLFIPHSYTYRACFISSPDNRPLLLRGIVNDEKDFVDDIQTVLDFLSLMMREGDAEWVWGRNKGKKNTSECLGWSMLVYHLTSFHHFNFYLQLKRIKEKKVDSEWA